MSNHKIIKKGEQIVEDEKSTKGVEDVEMLDCDLEGKKNEDGVI